MSKPGKDKDSKKPAGRGERLAAALRENLRRRKAQERGRASSTSDAEEGGKQDSAKDRGR